MSLPWACGPPMGMKVRLLRFIDSKRVTPRLSTECNHQQNLKTMRGAKSNVLFLRGANWNRTCPCVALVRHLGLCPSLRQLRRQFLQVPEFRAMAAKARWPNGVSQRGPANLVLDRIALNRWSAMRRRVYRASSGRERRRGGRAQPFQCYVMLCFKQLK